jgi:DNA polymerase
MPPDFIAHHMRVMAGEAVWAAWNAGFDKAIWNFATEDFPEMEARHIIDVMAQAVASGLPPDLDKAASVSGSIKKDKSGKDLMKLFCYGDLIATPQSHSNEWQQFINYAKLDVEAMRSVFLGTRQLPLAEWKEYWAMEKINERGILIDVEFAKRAAALADEDRTRSRAELFALTDGAVETVDQIKCMTTWLLTKLPAEGREIIVKREEETDENGVVVKPAKYVLTRRQVERLIALCVDKPELAGALRVLQIRLYGGSKTPAKFSKMLTQEVDGILYGQYVFNGASQTGRASSRGVQIQNLSRDILSTEHETIEAILRGYNCARLNVLNPDPVARQLSLLIRPTFVPSGDNVFVWSDWSQIEARILPWLAGAEDYLQIFRDVDADPSAPDLYTRTAAILFHVPVEQVTKEMRQRGKVAVLALGFGGGIGALQAMGAAYGLHVSNAEARSLVEIWRDANAWCVQFWDALAGAVENALRYPQVPQRVGRITYIYLLGYLGGSLLCQLPSGRCLTYRNIKYEQVADEDDDGNVIGYSTHLRCSRGHNRIKLWHGIFVENCIAGGTPVLTSRGWLSIEQVTTADMVWDGVEWVRHAGLIQQGEQLCMVFNGVFMTPEHEVLTDDGWSPAETSPRPTRKNIWLPDGRQICCAAPTAKCGLLGMPVLLRGDGCSRRPDFESYGKGWLRTFMPSLQIVTTNRIETNPRYVETSGFHDMVFDARTLSRSETTGVEKLRRTWDYGLSKMGKVVRSFLARHGFDVERGVGNRSEEQQRKLHSAQLSLGHASTKRKQQKEHTSSGYTKDVEKVTHTHANALHSLVSRPVYDLRNAGSRSRFMVMGDEGPFIVSNCVQAVAADILRGTLRRLENEKFRTRLHSHDEILVETSFDKIEETSARLREIMRWGFAWSDGLPLMSEESAAYHYSKHPEALIK